MTDTRQVRVGGLEVEYAEAGSGDEPFVLVHGFTGSRDDFADVLPTLGRSRRTITPDNRGHGGTTNPGSGYSLESMRDDLSGFLDELQIPSCHLLGHSLGGMIALRFVLAHPERVASLVLMDTAPSAPNMPAAVFEAGAKIVSEQGMEAMTRILQSNPSWKQSEPARRSAERMGEARYAARIEAKLLAMDPEAFIHLGRMLVDQPSVEDRLQEITCPTLVLVGDADVPFLAPSRLMAERIPNANLAVIPDAAHSPQLENEPAWLAALEAHLA